MVEDKKQQWKAWLYLSPALLLLAVFTIYPIINTICVAFLEGYNGMDASVGRTFTVGFGNFVQVFQADIGTYLKNTILLCVLTVPLSTILALVIAVCLNSIKFLQKPLQTIFFLPYVTNSIAIGMVFATMFNIVGLRNGADGEVIASSWGIINNVYNFLRQIIQPSDTPYFINWMNQGSTYFANMVVMVVYIVWNALPFKILILLGGLQSVNKQYYDAAKVDGTSRLRVFTRITVPLLSPMIAYVVITGFIGGFKEYTSIVGVFGDKMGPASAPYSLQTMVGYVTQMIGNKEGLASAASLILFAIILVVTLFNLWYSKKSVHY